jgi:hypothetical protein
MRYKAYVRRGQWEFTVIDVEYFTGITTNYFADYFKNKVGVNIDVEALKYATSRDLQKPQIDL